MINVIVLTDDRVFLINKINAIQSQSIEFYQNKVNLKEKQIVDFFQLLIDAEVKLNLKQNRIKLTSSSSSLAINLIQLINQTKQTGNGQQVWVLLFFLFLVAIHLATFDFNISFKETLLFCMPFLLFHQNCLRSFAELTSQRKQQDQFALINEIPLICSRVSVKTVCRQHLTHLALSLFLVFLLY